LLDLDGPAIAHLLQVRASGRAKSALILGHAFTITAEAGGPNRDLHIRRSAVIRLIGRPTAPFWVYR
jgi:hypothetical protein